MLVDPTSDTRNIVAAKRVLLYQMGAITMNFVRIQSGWDLAVDNI